MSGPPSGGRVRHSSPVRQTEQLLPVSSPPYSSPPYSTAVAADSPDQAWGRRERDAPTAGASSQSSAGRRGRPCAAAALLAAAVILALG